MPFFEHMTCDLGALSPYPLGHMNLKLQPIGYFSDFSHNLEVIEQFMIVKTVTLSNSVKIGSVR